jgi:predicted nucleic acid-binding protein
MIAVDASVAAKWLFRENGSEQALRFLQQFKGQLVAPDLIYVEVAGAIVRRNNSDNAYRQSARIVLASWVEACRSDVVRSYRLTPELLADASRIALEIGHPLKDCLYLSLAMDLGCELATADIRFRDKARPLNGAVRLLDEYQL